MMDYLNIGPVPSDEPAAQVGRDSEAQMRAECRVFARQLKRLFPAGEFRVKRFDHDFGRYYEVVAMFDPDDRSPEGVARYEAAIAAESETPTEWDCQALVELEKALESIAC